MNPEKRLTPETETLLNVHGVSHVQRVLPFSHQRLFQMFEDLTAQHKMCVNLYVANAKMPNAFAVDANNIIVTKPILELLNMRELRAVLAHELGHCKHETKHAWLSYAPAIGAGVAEALTVLTMAIALPEKKNLPLWGYAAAFASAVLGYYAVGKITIPQREFEADFEGVRLSEDAAYLHSALNKMQRFMSSKGLTSTGLYPSFEARFKRMDEQAKHCPQRDTALARDDALDVLIRTNRPAAMVRV